MSAALQYLKKLREAHPELSEWCNTLGDLYERQLWDQLTLKLEQFIALPIFQAGDAIVHLYHNFITEFELKINLLKLANFAVIVSGQYAEKEAAISYLEGVMETLHNTKEMCIEQPILYMKMQMALLKLEQGNEKECKELIDEGKITLDSMTDIDPSVYAYYDRVSSQYYKCGKDDAPLGQNEVESDENEGLGSNKGEIEANIHKDGDAEPIGSIIKRLRSKNQRKVKAGNDEETGGKGLLQTSGAESGNISKGEMMTLSEIQMLAKNTLNHGRKKMKEKSTLAEIMVTLRGKEKDKDGDSGERRDIEHEEKIEEDIGSQNKMGVIEGGYERVTKLKISAITKFYQRRTKLIDKSKPFSSKEKEKGREEEEDHEEKENGHKDVREDSCGQNLIDICSGKKGEESDMEEEMIIDKKMDTEKKRKENEHGDANGLKHFTEKEEKNETLAEMQILAKKKINKGRMKLKQGKEKEQKDQRDNCLSQEQVEEDVNLEKENGLEEEMVVLLKRSDDELLDRREDDVSSKKQMDEKKEEEVTLAVMRMSAKKLNQEREKLNNKEKNTSVKKKQQDKDDEQGKDKEQKGIEEQEGEEEKENDREEVPAVEMKRKRDRYRIAEVNCPDIGNRTREKRERRKTSKFESLDVLERREAIAKEIEMEEGLHDEEEMTIMNLRKKRARQKPAELCSFEVIKSASSSPISDAETIKSGLEIVSTEDFDVYDFKKDRIGRNFQKGQVWAIYDDKDGMPRHYAVIDEVVSVNPFQVQLNWLDFQDTGAKALTSREKMVLPIACGSFKVSISVIIKSRKIFSHITNSERVAREIYMIYPKKGSIWAMFNDDAMDIIVCLTSYSEIYGLSMAYLERVDGFTTVYKRREIGAHAIKFLEGNDFRLFSHHIPARKLSDEEVSGLPKDCWELDPAALPESLSSGGKNSGSMIC